MTSPARSVSSFALLPAHLRATLRGAVAAGLGLWVASLSPVRAQVILSTHTTLGPTPSPYEGQSLVVSNAVLTISGTHAFQSLVLTHGATLTHPAPGTNHLHLTVTGSCVIEADSAVNLDARGYAGGAGPGAGLSASFGTGGGSHGGTGGAGRNSAGGGTFGSYREPVTPGSSGGKAANYSPGAAGGGALRLTVAQELVVNGRLSADGANAGEYGGGGAGGSLWIETDRLAGTGTISARGGAGEKNAGGGGGGRIALHVATDAFTGTVVACGGPGNPLPGGAGSVFRRRPPDPVGTLVLDNCGTEGGFTEWDPEVTLTDKLHLLHGATLAPRPRSWPTTWRFLEDVRVDADGHLSADARGSDSGEGDGTSASISYGTGGASYGGSGGNGLSLAGRTFGSPTQPTNAGSGAAKATGYGPGGSGGGALRLEFLGEAVVDGTISANGGDGGNYAGGGSGGSLWISAPRLHGNGAISAHGGSGEKNSGGGGGGRIALYLTEDTFEGTVRACGAPGAENPGGAGTVYLKLDAQPRGNLLIHNCGEPAGVTEVEANFHWSEDLQIEGGGTLTPRLGEARWQIQVDGKLVVGPAGAISATGRGPAGGAGEGAGEPTAYSAAGGSHGGRGGDGSQSLATLTYGSFTEPATPGSGGGNATNYEAGGRGGSAVGVVVAEEFHLDGRLESNGGPGGNYAGGGSGGSVYVIAPILSGSGRLSANGGAGLRPDTGGGGGGRIAVYYDTLSDTIRDQAECAGGPGGEIGGAGTLYFKSSSAPLGDLVIDRTPNAVDPAPTLLYGNVVVPGNLRIRSSALVQPPPGHPLHLTVRGDLTLASGAAIQLNGLGYAARGGPGASGGNGGASHGGAGGLGQGNVPGGFTYGDPNLPIDLGSGGGSQPGGGALRLSVQGTFRLDGTISADAATNTTGPGGSGGSIAIRAGRLVGSGTLSAKGGNTRDTTHGGGGSGGRIALAYQGNAFPTNRISVAGGTGLRPGESGTLVIERGEATSPPALLAAVASPSQDLVALTFSSPLDARTAENTNRYRLSGPTQAQVLAAELQQDLQTVLLTTTDLAGGATYTVTAEGLCDGVGGCLATPATLSFVVRGTVRGSAREELFLGIPGSQLGALYADSRWPLAPDQVNSVARLAAPRDDLDGDELGARLTGYVVPERTGWHRFFLASDNNGIFYLSPDHVPAHARLLASEPRGGLVGDWLSSANADVIASRGRTASNASMPVWLVAGRYYWFDAQVKEGTLAEHLAVTWQAPGEAPPEPNEGTRISGELLAHPVADQGPQILAQPRGGNFDPGQSTTLRVQATGTGTLRYQWYFNGTPITGATRDTLDVAALGSTTFGGYRVRVTDSLGVVDSRTAQLVAALPTIPVFTQHPRSQRVTLGTSVILSGQSSGQPPLTYQWLLNGQPIPDATDDLLTLPVMRRRDAGRYTLLVTNPGGSRESEPALVEIDVPRLTVGDAFAQRPIITTANWIGTTNTLTATRENAAGEPRHAGKPGGRSVWVTWRPPASGVATVSTVGSGFDTLLAVYTGDSLAGLTAVASDEDSGTALTSVARFNAVGNTAYHVAVDGFDGAAGTLLLSGELATNAPVLPRLLTAPASALAAPGDTVEFTVNASPADVTYQWFFNGLALPGATDATLRRAPVLPADAGNYHVRVRTTDGAALDSPAARLELSDRPDTPPPLSADKLADLFNDAELGGNAGFALQALDPRPHGAAAPPAVGLPGSHWTDNTQSSRGEEDGSACSVLTTATRWFRLRFNLPAGIQVPLRVTTDGSEIPTFIAVFTNRADLRLVGCDLAAPPEKPSASARFQARRDIDYLVLVDGLRGGRGPIRLNWAAEEEAGGVTVGLQEGHLVVEMRVAPATYDWQTADRLGAWQTVLRTNLGSGEFRFTDPQPASGPSRFYRLTPATP